MGDRDGDSMRDLAERFLSGEMSAEEQATFEALLHKEEGALRETLAEARRQVALRRALTLMNRVSQPKTRRKTAVFQGRPVRRWTRWAVGGAACFIAAVLAAVVWDRGTPAPAPVGRIRPEEKSPQAAPTERPEPVPVPAPRPESQAPKGVEPEPVKEEPRRSTPVPPAPEVPPPAPPAEERIKEPSKPGKTVVETATARLGPVKGAVYINAVSEQTRAREGLELRPGQRLLTKGTESAARLLYADATQLSLGSDTEIRLEEGEIQLSRGELDVQASREWTLTTPHARVQSTGSRLMLNCGLLGTRLEMLEGSARFTDLRSQAVLDVKAGQVQVAGGSTDEAIRKGIEYLKGATSPTWEWIRGNKNSHELILLTFLHSGLVPEDDPLFQRYFKEMMAAPPQRTYSAALQAMVLEELDRVKYQARIAQCAQYLVDTQCANGQWTYGENLELPDFPAKSDVQTPGKVDASGRRIKPKVVRKIVLQKRRDGPAEGDNSNAQYAALGLRACHDAGIVLPREALERASKWLRSCQHPEEKIPRDKRVATGAGAAEGPGRGWCYEGRSPNNGKEYPPCMKPWGSMTVGATGSLVLYDYMLGLDWKRDPAVKAGIQWLAANFATDEHPAAATAGFKPDYNWKTWALYYYLYALERLGVFTDLSKFGGREWYPEGAGVLLSTQRPDGSWMYTDKENSAEWDTCFAILFLKRATRPLVASEDRVFRK